MRGILRSSAPILLLILAIPVIAIAYTLAAGSQPRAEWWLFQWASTACLVIGLVLAFIGVAVGYDLRRKPLDERALERHLATVLLGADLVVVSFALLFAIFSAAVGLLISGIAAAWILVWSVPRLRHVQVSSSFVIERSPEVVFAFISDFRNEPRYSAGVESVEMLTADPIGPGTQFRTHVRLQNRVFDGVEEIVEYEPHSRFTSRLPAALHRNLDEHTFEPLDGGTLVTHRFDFERSLNSCLLGRWFRQPAMNRLLLDRRHQRETRLKQILES